MAKAQLSINEDDVTISTKDDGVLVTMKLVEFFSIIYSVFNDNEVAEHGLTFSNVKYGIGVKAEGVDVLIATKGLVFVIMPLMQSDIVFSDIQYREQDVVLSCPEPSLSITIPNHELKAFNAQLMTRDRTKVDTDSGDSHYYRNDDGGASCFSWKHGGVTIGGKIDVAGPAIEQAQKIIAQNPEAAIDDLKSQIEQSSDEGQTKGIQKVLETVEAMTS